MKRLSKFFILGTVLAGVAHAGLAQSSADAARIFGDPDFQQRLLGSFGVRAEVEPPAFERAEADFFNSRVVEQAQAGNFDAAIAALREAVTPESNANFDFTLATLYLQQGNLQQARRYYDSAIEKHPEFMRAHKNLGIVLAQLGDFPAALNALQKAIELGDFDGDTFGLLGYSFFNLGEYMSSLDAYRMASILNPENREWRVGKSRVLIETGQNDQAVAALKELIEENPADTRFWQTRANAHVNQGEYLEAIASLEVMRRLEGASVGVLSLLGNLYTNQFLPELATNVYLEALDKGLKAKEAIQVVEVFSQRGYDVQAARLIAAVRDHFGDSLEQNQRISLLNLEATIAMGQGDMEGGAEILEKILQEDPTDGRALLLLAQYHRDQNELGDAEYYFERAENSREQRIAREALVSHAVMKVGQSEYGEAADLLRRALAVREEARLRDYLEAVERAAQR